MIRERSKSSKNVPKPQNPVSESPDISRTDKALILRAQGLTTNQIAEELGTTPATVRVIFNRTKDMTAEEMAKRLTSITPTTAASVTLNKRQNERMAAITVSTEEKATLVHELALKTVRDALKSPELDMRSRAWVALEFLKTRKSAGSITVNQQNNVQTINTTPEDAHGRLKALAARIERGSREILPPSTDGGEGEE